MPQYDVVIIGGGPGGYNAAIRAGQLGLKVACVEARKTLGGTCLNVGCIPSKALLNASNMFEEARTGFAALGIKVSPELDLPQMLKQKDDSVVALTKGVEFLFKKNKVDWIKGRGALAGAGKVSVKAEDGSETLLEAKAIVIATGSEPSKLAGVEVDQKRIVDSTGALALSPVPKSAGRDRRGHHRAGARLGLAPARGGGRGGGVPGPHHSRRRRRTGDPPSSGR